ncbi:hypothetical protein ACHAXT_006634 [Thalassiosira profunda]
MSHYSFSSAGRSSNISDSYSDEEGGESAYSYSDAAAAALEASSSSRGSNRDIPAKDVPVEGHCAIANFDTSARSSLTSDALGETVDFDDAPDDSHMTGRSSPRSSHRANQEYYDVLEMASSRLRQDEEARDVSSGNEAVVKKKQRKKKRKKRSKKDRRRRQSNQSADEDDGDGEGRRRSAVFQQLFPPEMMKRGSLREKFTSSFSERDLHAGYVSTDDEIDFHPDELERMKSPQKWSPAALVTAAQSKMHGGKVDARGFYTNVKGRADSAYHKVQRIATKSERGMPSDFNLHSLGKSRKRSSRDITESIDWGDESLTGRDVEYADDDDDASEGIEMVDDCSYADLNDASASYLMIKKRVRGLMWQRDKRRIRICLFVAIIFFGTCIGLFLSSRSGDSENSPLPQSSNNDDNGIGRTEPPPRPLPPAPKNPAEGFDAGSVLHSTKLTDLLHIVEKITPDAAVFGNPHSPQSKALEWAKNDLTIYDVEASRVAQRYALATLYYATNGTGWTTNTKWGNGHECEWFGVGCETGESNVPSVTYIDLNSNNLGGTIPPEIGSIASLEQIHLWGNNLSGSLPSRLSQLGSLHTLYLDKNVLEGEMGDTFDQMKSLRHLDLSSNRLRGHIPHGLGSLINLRDLRLSNNLLTATVPISLISLSNLQTLLLDSNSISGTLPTLVGEMRSLVTIRVHENDLKGTIPSFKDAVLLEEAHFDGNYFSGPIPRLGSTRLREIYLGQNALTGGIPDSIGNLDKLETFSASANELNGMISSSLSKATSLQILELSHNKLSGELPSELSGLWQMRELRLDNNQLEGFPSWLGEMKHLELIHLNNNMLGGKLDLPVDVGDLEDLKEFAIQQNHLTGVVEEFICDLLLDVLTADCYGSPPPVDCPCCTKCF